MANEEALVLDSLALNDGTTLGMLSLSCPPPRERQDWIGAADSEAQLLFRKPLHENRKVTARLVVLPQASMDLAHDKIALVVDKLAKASKYTDGIALTWTPATGTRTVTFTVYSGEITDLPIDWESGWLSKSPEFTIELTCHPYWRGTEVLTSTASSSTPFVTLEVANVTGDVPALGRLIVTDTATQSRRHVEWGLEGPLTYNNATSLLIDSDSMVTSGFAGSQTTFAGSYDPNATGNNAITCNVASQTIAVCGTGNLSHVGVFRVKARIAPPTLNTEVRFSWRAGDGPMTSNAWVSVRSNYCELDLGTITVPVVVAGTQRWTGQVEVRETAGGSGALIVDYLVLVPASDGYGKARATYSGGAGVVTAIDDFLGTTAGNALNARVAPIGGTWATSGATTDFAFSDTNAAEPSGEAVTRSTTSDSGRRFALLGSTNFTDTEASTRVQATSAPNSASSFFELGLILRWVDSSNYLAVYRKHAVDASLVSSRSLVIDQVVAGVTTTLAAEPIPSSVASSQVFHTIRAVVFASGRVIATQTTNGAVTASTEASATAIATGGTLASGKPGFFDRSTSTIASGSRFYDDFTVSTPAAEPIAIYSGRNMQIRYDDVIRQDSTGTYTGRPQSYRGSRFLVPVGTSRVLVKARRNDIEAATDDNVTDATQVQVAFTPRGLAVPR